MLNGLPQCKYCYQQFTTWRSFSHHVQRGCQVKYQDPSVRGDRAIRPELEMPTFPSQPPKVDAVVRGAKLLTAAELRNIHQQEWGRRLLVIIGHRHWHHLRLETAATEFLSKRCCLCDQWVGRVQEMHRHMRLFHAEHWPQVMARSTQLSNQYADEAPCAYCKCVFKSTHTCNVWTQVALLLIGGAGITETAMPASEPNLVCEICNLAMPTVDAMHLHLASEHQLTQASWNVSRDALDGQPVCAHCSMHFANLASLRSHIVQGRCTGYDALQTTEPAPIKPEWVKALCEGELLHTLKDPRVRLVLTLHYQCCAQKYSRAGDLALHLQSSHSALWTASEPLTLHMVALCYHSVGCICNPGISAKRINHVCLPWRQLAMQYCRLEPDLIFMPQLVQESNLQQIYSVDLPRSMKFELDKFLCERNFSLVWLNQEFMLALRCTCTQCAGFFHPAELALHLREAHQCCNDLAQFYLQALTPLMLQHSETDYQCTTCLLTYNLPSSEADETAQAARQRLAQAHCRAQCPVLLQLASVLSLAAHGGRSGHAGQSDRFGTDHECLPQHGSVPGQGPATGRESRPPETSAKRRRSQTAPRSSTTRHGQNAEHSGETGDPSVSGNPVDQKRGHLPALFQQQRKNRGSSTVVEDGGDLACSGATTAGAEASNATPPRTSPGADAGSLDQIEQAGRGRPSVRTEASCAAAPNPPAGHDGPISGMEHGAQEASAEPEDPAQPEAHGRQRSGVPGNVLSTRSHIEIPLPSTTGFGDTMEVAIEPESRSGVPVDAGVLPVKHMGATGSVSQEPQSSSERTGCAVGRDDGPDQSQGQVQRTWERQIEDPHQAGEVTTCSNRLDRIALLGTVSTMVMQNPNNWCFANASLYSMLWTTLSLREFDQDVWGMQCNQLIMHFSCQYDHSTWKFIH